jgi:hypothetical protein
LQTKVAGIVIAIVILGLVVYVVSKQGRPDSSGTIQRQVVRSAPPGSIRAPDGCDIISGQHRILRDQGLPSESDWVPTQFSFCQLPESWRRVVRHTRVGDEVEYRVPAALVPIEIAQLLRISPGHELSIAFRTQAIDAPPEGLSFPRDSRMPETARETPLGVRYVLTPGDQNGPEVTEGSTVAVHYSFWKPNGTLVATSRLGASPTVLSVGNMDGYVRELLLVAAHEGDRLLAWVPQEAARSETALLLDARIEKVFR